MHADFESLVSEMGAKFVNSINAFFCGGILLYLTFLLLELENNQGFFVYFGGVE